MWNDGNFFHGGGFMWLLWIILILGLFVVFFNLFDRGRNNGTKDRDTPLDILKKRYARGEIDEQEYQRRRDELMNS